MAGYKHLEIVRDFEKYVKDKKVSAEAYYRYLLSRLLRMFQYKNLPDTIPHEILDRYLFENGIACITEVNGKLYCFYGNLGGPQDVYYRPTEFIIANPHIKVNNEIFSANVPVFPDFTSEDLGQPTSQAKRQNGVLIRNDTEWFGLHPLLSRYAYLMAENTLTLRTADVMLRVLALISAKTDDELSSAKEYLKSIEKGELGVIGESLMFEGINLQSPPSNNGSYLTQFIEYQQYLKGSFFNEVGLSANYNMKREAIGTGESTLDSDSILPLCDNMLKCRREDLAKVNEQYSDLLPEPIEVDFSSSWLTNKIETLESLKEALHSNMSPSFGFGNNPSELNSGDDVGQPINNESGLGQDGTIMGQNPIDVDAKVGDVADDANDAEETVNEESKVNDISVDEEVTDILEELVDQQEGVESNEPDDTEGSSEDKTDIPED